MIGCWYHQVAEWWLDGFWSHAATLATCEGEKGSFLTGEGLGVEQMKPARALWAVLWEKGRENMGQSPLLRIYVATC